MLNFKNCFFGKRYYHFVKFVIVCTNWRKEVNLSKFTFSANFSMVYMVLRKTRRILIKIIFSDTIKLV